MLLKGSCHCQSVRFQVDSAHYYPFNRCYCSVCRKTAGGGGYAINLGGDFSTMRVEGKENVSVYHARIDGEVSRAERHFCSLCGSSLWLYDPRWPDLVHPHASAIDTELPVPPEHSHMMLDSKAGWIEIEGAHNDKCFREYPDESLAQWHERVVSNSA